MLTHVSVLSSATSTSVTAALTLSSQHVNSRGSLHGAVSAALVDLLGGLAIASTGLEKTGASVDIHVTYQSTANIGDHIEVTAQCEKAGRNLGFTKITIHKLKGEERILVASGSHTKFIG